MLLISHVRLNNIKEFGTAKEWREGGRAEHHEHV